MPFFPSARKLAESGVEKNCSHAAVSTGKLPISIRTATKELSLKAFIGWDWLVVPTPDGAKAEMSALATLRGPESSLSLLRSIGMRVSGNAAASKFCSLELSMAAGASSTLENPRVSETESAAALIWRSKMRWTSTVSVASGAEGPAASNCPSVLTETTIACTT